MKKLKKGNCYSIDLLFPMENEDYIEYSLNNKADKITNKFLKNNNLVCDYEYDYYDECDENGNSKNYVKIYFDSEICTFKKANEICDELIEMLNNEEFIGEQNYE